MKTQPALNERVVKLEPDTLRIQRLLPGPIERVWAYLTRATCAGDGLRKGRWSCALARRSR